MNHTQIECAILKALQEKGTIPNSIEFAQHTLLISHNDLVGAIKSLECDSYVTTTITSKTEWTVTTEGQRVIQEGSPEHIVYQYLLTQQQCDSTSTASSIPMSTVEEKYGKEFMSIALSQGIKGKLFTSCKEGATVHLKPNTALKKGNSSDIVDDARVKCELIASGKSPLPSQADLDALKKRKLIQQETKKIFQIEKGLNYSMDRKKVVADITREMLVSGSWKGTTFKPYNVTAPGRPPIAGALHPLMKVRQEFREIFLELGFKEMETQNFVESCFWNFDALFVPQKHPARDLQDTFYISNPKTSHGAGYEEYMQRVKETHEHGADTGSLGYRCPWTLEESTRNVLRTHTTAVTARLLYSIAQSSPLCPDGIHRQCTPGRYFSIDRVFRNEEMDKTHLCEFHQIEGFVLDTNLSLAHMMHILHQFFTKIGIHKLKFKPAYNPYTEPSMEIFGYHEGFKKWVEVGNSGVFRPEMMRPMGFEENVTAVAWGLSLERPTMIKYGISNIHDLFGHKVDLGFIRRSPICRL